MRIYGHESCHQACVLPFAGRPREISDLRRVVGDQLSAWGASALTDLAELVVTELAANVVKHVGEGAPATLLMDFDGNHVNVQLHDTSPKLPTIQSAGWDAESGRGLALVAAISTDWGSVPTRTGKAVWCRLTPEPGPLPTATRRRVRRAVAALETYGRECNGGCALPTLNLLVQEQLAAYLIADLLHSLSTRGVDPADLLDRAQTHFESTLA